VEDGVGACHLELGQLAVEADVLMSALAAAFL
jgi:hypothetical protein